MEVLRGREEKGEWKGGHKGRCQGDRRQRGVNNLKVASSIISLISNMVSKKHIRYFYENRMTLTFRQ